MVGCMRTVVRKVGNSRGVLIPAALLKTCGITEEVELKVENQKLIIEPVKQVREGWFETYQESNDVDVWGDFDPQEENDDWVW